MSYSHQPYSPIGQLFIQHEEPSGVAAGAFPSVDLAVRRADEQYRELRIILDGWCAAQCAANALVHRDIESLGEWMEWRLSATESGLGDFEVEYLGGRSALERCLATHTQDLAALQEGGRKQGGVNQQLSDAIEQVKVRLSALETPGAEEDKGSMRSLALRVEKLETALQGSLAANKVLKSRVSQLEGELKGLTESVSRRTPEAGLKSRVKQLAGELKGLAESVSRLTSERVLQSQVNQLEGELKSLAESVSKRTPEAGLNGRVNQLEGELKSLAESVNRLTSEGGLQSQINQVDRELKSLAANKHGSEKLWQGQIEQIKDSLKTLSSSGRGQSDSLMLLKREVKNLSEGVGALSKTEEKLKTEVEQCRELGKQSAAAIQRLIQSMLLPKAIEQLFSLPEERRQYFLYTLKKGEPGPANTNMILECAKATEREIRSCAPGPAPTLAARFQLNKPGTQLCVYCRETGSVFRLED